MPVILEALRGQLAQWSLVLYKFYPCETPDTTPHHHHSSWPAAANTDTKTPLQ